MSFAATKIDLQIAILSDVRQRQISDTAYKWDLEKRYKYTYLKNRKRLTDLENKHGCQGEGLGRRNS